VYTTFRSLWIFIKSRKLQIYLIVGLVTLLFIQLLARTTLKYDSFTFDLHTVMGKPGGTIIAVPPVGRLFLKTHLTPWQLIITLDEIDFKKLEKQLDSLPSKQLWLQTIEREFSKTFYTFFALVAICGLFGGIITMFAFRIKPRSHHFWYGILVSLAVILILLGSTIATYDEHAINHPQYQGVLASAPWVMNLISMGLDNIEAIGNNLKRVSQELPMLYKQAGTIKNLSELQTDLAVLHVSDIHNNPAAFDFIQELVVNFKINFIIDTGDLTDYGTPLEAKITKQFNRIKVPYVYVPGNHDSPFLLRQLKHLPHIRLITKGFLKIDGLLICGIADPASFHDSAEVASPLVLNQFKTDLDEIVFKLKKSPDIVAIHNSRLVSDLIGKVPLILYGHDHQYHISVKQKTVIDDAGTTGSAGLRGLTETSLPYSASIIYWKKDASGNLRIRAADSIKIDGVEGFLTITRHTF
jgi:Icc-related predicted phosphoesterase